MDKPDLLLWTGPVWAGNLAGTKWAVPTEILSLSCTGSDGCAALGANLPATGKLAALLVAHGKRASDYDKIILGGFSAGHGLSDLLLRDQATRERLDAYCAFDSYYTGAAPGIKPGVLEFAKLAAAGSKLMWSSASGNPDRKWLSCEESIQPLLAALDLSACGLPGSVGSLLAKPPAYVKCRGKFVHAFYNFQYAHAEHATIIGPAVLGGWISPALHRSSIATWVLGGFGVGAAAGLVWWLLSGRRRNPMPVSIVQAERAARAIGIDWAREHFTARELRDGMIVEQEHGDVIGRSLQGSARIARAHLRECHDYYERLAALESACQERQR